MASTPKKEADAKPGASDNDSSPKSSAGSANSNSDAVEVALRVRPFNSREKALGDTKSVVMMSRGCVWTETLKEKEAAAANASTGLRSVGKQGTSQVVAGTKHAFDYCLWSVDKSKTEFVDQEIVYKRIGAPLLDRVFQGFNVCLFAYGQTGSGKTHTMMGNISDGFDNPDVGLIPRMCADMFERMKKKTNEYTTFRVQASYIELYNEQVCDLLAKDVNPDLKVREDPKTGPFVQGLKLEKVDTVESILKLIVTGNRQRHVAATKMNSESSRSHAIFTLYFEEEAHDDEMDAIASASRVNLVDLAGSESISKSGVVGVHQVEAISINLSLTTLRQVIDSLANKKKVAPPYRDSKLTWLLKDSLGNNAKTCMIATVSPSANNIAETRNTLHYASLARAIQNKAKANQDESIRLVQDLQNEVASLRAKLSDQAFFEGKGLTPEKLQAMEAELAFKQEQEASLKAKVEQLSLERKLKENKEEELRASNEEKERLRKERMALEDKLQERHAKESKMKANLEELDGNYKQAQTKLNEQQRRLDELVAHKQQLEKDQKERAILREKLEKEGADKDQRLAACNDEIATLKDRVDGLERELETKEAELEQAETEVDEKKEKLLALRETMSNEVVAMETRVKETEDQLQEAVRDGEEKDTQIAELVDSLEEAKGETKDARQSAETLKNELDAAKAAADKEKDDLRGEIERLKKELRETKDALSDRESELAALRARLAALESQLETAKAQQDETQAALDDTRNQLSGAQKDVEATERALQEKREELTGAQEESKGRLKELDAVKAELTARSGTLAEIKKALDQKVDEVKDQRGEIESIREKQRSTEEAYEESKAALSDEVAERESEDRQKECDSLSADLETTQEKLRAKTDEFEQVTGTLRDTEGKLQETEASLAETKDQLASTQTELAATKATLSDTEAKLQTTSDSLSSTTAETTQPESEPEKPKVEEPKAEEKPAEPAQEEPKPEVKPATPPTAPKEPAAAPVLTPPTEPTAPKKKQRVHRTLDLAGVKAKISEDTERYVLGKQLGKGAYGVVVEATVIETGDKVAIKRIAKDWLAKEGEAGDKRLYREVAIMGALQHPNLANLRELLYEKKSNEMWIVLELVKGAELMKKICQAERGRLNEKEARSYFQQLVVGLNYVHVQGMVHRDLKPENILVTDEGVCKITDFGLSNIQNTDTQGKVPSNMNMQTCCGTPYYVAPEVFTKKGGYSGFTADVWSLGIILYVMLVGDLPFTASELRTLLQRISKGEYSIPDGIDISEDATDLIKKMLNPKSKTRIKLGEIAVHPWFVAGGFEATQLQVNETYDQDAVDHLKNTLGEWGERAMAANAAEEAEEKKKAEVQSNTVGIGRGATDARAFFEAEKKRIEAKN
ncbi:Kinesin-like protein K39 [Diplonema papillatum]|nr:Kinesin-like protein K39 [Diplonema papillatum]